MTASPVLRRMLSISLTREQITLLPKGLSFIPSPRESDPRELMNDMGQFIRNTKIKCGKLIVQSQRQYRMRPRQVAGTPQLTSSYAENCHWHKQNDWPSNRLLSSQMEDTLHAMSQELAILTDKESDNVSKKQSHNLTRNERTALTKFSKTRSLIFKKGARPPA